MPTLTLTDLAVRKLTIPERGQTTYYDKSLKGFGVRVSPGGTKTFVLVHGKKRKRTSLGRYGVISLANARKKAKGILYDETLNPNQAPSLSFSEALTRYLDVHCEPRLKPRTYKENKWLLERHFLPDLSDTELKDITPHDVTPILDGLLETPSLANHAFTALRTFLRWCVSRSYIPYDPIAGLRKPAKTVSRDRVLSDEELTAVLKAAAEQGRYGQIIISLALLGQRAGQIAKLHNDYIDKKKKLIRWPGEAMKNNKEHIIPYGRWFAKILKEQPSEGFVFPTNRDKALPFNTWSKTKKAFDKACPLPHWTLHDLRRTFSTGHAKLGTEPHIVERILAHTGGTVSGVAAIYNRHAYIDEMRAALTKWERHLEALFKS